MHASDNSTYTDLPVDGNPQLSIFVTGEPRQMVIELYVKRLYLYCYSRKSPVYL